MKSNCYIFYALIFLTSWSCTSDTGSGGATQNDGGGPITHTLDTAVGYCFQLSKDGVEEAIELGIYNNKIKGEGVRIYRANQAVYNLIAEGILEGNQAEMRIVATNSRDSKETFTHIETWEINEDVLVAKNRKIKNLEGDYSFRRTYCHQHENSDTTLYDSFGEYFEGYAVVSKNGKFGLINEAGVLTIPLAFRDIGIVREGRITFYDEYLGLRGIMDVNGNVLLEPKYIELMAYSNGLAAFLSEEGKWGFLNLELEIAIEPKYTNVNFFKPDPTRQAFSEGLANVQVENDKWNYIDTKGNRVIAGDFLFTEPFKNGEARVFKNNKWYTINKAGKCIKNCD
ncbi:WG repeat-containing protein [Aureispira anguillae]|uniref:WG repeat-containing protein n=1 Tax=Aureispira anguillae TaxID=2864201 RepID=A0A915YDT2_9BACT|nr:WG repeat-containing protein [Aureispira anguillae]BDS11255.1 WG repeat-containing protein [Aureispira anguillae]